MKTCSKCKLDKLESEFRKRRASKDGLQPRCKPCENAWHKVHYEKHHERYKANAHRWYRDNHEKALAYKAEQRRQNPKYASEWFKAHPGYSKSKLHAYRARKRGNGGTFTAEEWVALCELYDNRCLCCGERRPLTRDHVIPISKGGSNTVDNLQPLCFSCNSSKRDKIIDYRFNT